MKEYKLIHLTTEICQQCKEHKQLGGIKDETCPVISKFSSSVNNIYWQMSEINNSKNKNIQWKWTNLKRILTLLCKNMWIASKLSVQWYGFILNSVYLCEPFSFRYIWYRANNMNRCRKEPFIWKKESQLPACKLGFTGRTLRFKWHKILWLRTEHTSRSSSGQVSLLLEQHLVKW